MKNKNNPNMLFIRKKLAENLVAKRRLAREIKNYALYDLSNRKVRHIIHNINYLRSLINSFQKLDNEYLTLCGYYYEVSLVK